MAYRPSTHQEQYEYNLRQSAGPIVSTGHRAASGPYVPAPGAYLDPVDDRHTSHRRRHRSGSRSSRRRSGSDDRYEETRSHRNGQRSRSCHRSSSRSRTQVKSVGATAVGGAAGALLGHQLGNNKLATAAGLIAGAMGAHELEKRHERHTEKKRYESDGYARGSGKAYESSSSASVVNSERQRRKSGSGNIIESIKGRIEGLVDGGNDKRHGQGNHGRTARSYDRRSSSSSDSDSDRDRRHRRRSHDNRY